MKILEIKGLKYSTKQFDDYKCRAIVELDTMDSTHRLDIYTTDIDKENVWDTLLDIKTGKVISFRIVHWTTREQDDMATKVINEWLKEE